MITQLNNNFKNITIILASVVSFYFWDFGEKYNLNIETRFLILIPLIFFFNFENFKFKKIKIILIINFYLIIQYVVTYLYNDTYFTINDAIYFLAFLLTSFFTLLCKDQILENKFKITKFIILLAPLFLISSEISIWPAEDLLWQCSLFDADSKLFKLFFLENSHYAMIAISPLMLHTYLLCKKFSLINLILIIIYFFSLIFYNSTTMVVSSILICLIFLFIGYRQISKLYLFNIFIIFITFAVFFTSIYGCSRKVTDLVYHHYLNVEKQVYEIEVKKNQGQVYEINYLKEFYFKNFLKIFKKTNYKNYVEAKKILNERIKEIEEKDIEVKEKNDLEIKKNNLEIEKNNLEIEKNNLEIQKKALLKVNVSSQVVKNSIEIAIKSIKNQFYGFGLNRFQNAFMQNINSQKNNYSDEIMQINRNDGASNFSKLITEFGIIALILFIYIAVFTFSKKISLENKLFLLPIVITQMLRGAGYFNGGFLICIILIVLLVHDKKEI